MTILTGQLTLGLVVAVSVLVVGGIIAITHGLKRSHPRLDDALGALNGEGPGPVAFVGEATSTSERAGLWLYRRTPVPLLESQLRLLELKNKSVAEFYADKLVLAVLGAVVPGVMGVLFTPLLGFPVVVPVLASVLGFVVGYFVPDLQLKRASARVATDAEAALFTYFDLVTLERLANQSATQSLTAAAEVSDNPLFVSIRSALMRARLEQHPPYAELRRLAERLQLPQLADVADVMQLDESGAGVSGTLRARVRELRDAHLTESKIAAHEVSERMTVAMAIPAMVFGLIFLVPPLMRLVG